MGLVPRTFPHLSYLVRTQWNDGCLRTRKQPVSKCWIWQCLDLRLLASTTVTNKLLLFISHLVCGVLWEQPEWLRHTANNLLWLLSSLDLLGLTFIHPTRFTLRTAASRNTPLFASSHLAGPSPGADPRVPRDSLWLSTWRSTKQKPTCGQVPNLQLWIPSEVITLHRYSKNTAWINEQKRWMSKCAF